MYEVPCLNLNGDTINRFYQWDIDQKIVIDLNGCDERYLQNPPEVHFSNSSRKEALVVRSTVKYSGDDVAVQDDSVATMHAGDIIIADIPNILLQEPYPLLVYVYSTDADDSSSQKTILYSEIPVRKRAKPSDYLYVENITRITAEMIKKEIESSTETARTNAINKINDIKTKSIATVTDTRDTAVNTITQTKTNAVSTVDEAKEDFITTGNGLVNTATKIKNNTQKTYDDAVSVANKTQQTIETNINTLITKNGVYLKTVNDGSGNANLAILVNQS